MMAGTKTNSGKRRTLTRVTDMTIKTIKALIEQTNIPATLVRSTIRQAGGWDSFRESAADIANHGAAGGFHGFIFYSYTVPFAKRNMRHILAYADQLAHDCGQPGALDLIAGFNCLKGYTALDVSLAIHKRGDENQTEVLNALAWFALEEVARAYSDLCDQ